jgi:hypothetical protein
MMHEPGDLPDKRKLLISSGAKKWKQKVHFLAPDCFHFKALPEKGYGLFFCHGIDGKEKGYEVIFQKSLSKVHVDEI